MKIPTKFKLFGETITVEYDENLVTSENMMGHAKYATNSITLQTPNGKPYTKDRIEQTFLHELTHIILYKLKEDKLATNEKLVETFSCLLHQALETMEYK